MKRIIAVLAVLAMAGIAHAINTTNYVPDGNFESPNGGVGPWGNQFGSDTISFLSTGGNSNGCVQIADAGSFGGIAYVNPVPGPSSHPTLASLGLTAGQTYTFVMDMKIVSGTGIGGLKIESWNDTSSPNAALDNSGNMYPISGTASWATYSFTYKIVAGSTHLNVVPLWGPNSTVNYDNIGVVVVGPTPVNVSITSPTNSQVVYSNFTINASASVSPGTVASVGFYVDNTFAGNATSAPFAYVATGIAAGAHTITAVANDSGGNLATSSVVNITVTSAAPPPFAAYEPFHYTSLASGTPTTGSGFTGNWLCGAPGTIVSGLTYPNLTVTNSALQSSGSYQLESLATTPSGITTVWVSFLFSQTGDNGGVRDGFVLEDSTGKGVMFAYQQGQATYGSPALTTVSGYTAVGTQLSPYSATTQTYANNNFYVLQLSYAGGSLSSVAVYSNPTAGSGQTTPPAADFTVSSGLGGIGVLNTLGVVHQGVISLTVDEVRVATSYAAVVGSQTAATVTLGNLNQGYDGTAKSATATTTPPGLTVHFTYNGSPNAPTNLGTYQVVGTVTTAGYFGSATNNLVISQGTVTVTLGNLNQMYDGTARNVTATTIPSGLTVNLAYNGSANAPTNTGTYQVIGSVSNANFYGSATNNLVVSQAPIMVTLGNLNQTYDGTARNATATTTPPGLTVNLTYDGSVNAPTNIGTYQVIGTVTNANSFSGSATNYYNYGSATNNLVVSQALATVTLTDLNHTYDGTAKSATATTTPPGLTVILTYHGFTNQPIKTGIYELIGTVSDLNYYGGATNSFVITNSVETPQLGITSVVPGTGRTNGGTVVTITGLNFLPGVTVQFGGNAGTGVSLTGSTSISVSTPAGALGAVDVIVANTNSLSATNAGGFTYVPPPPPATIVSGSVVMSGSNLNMVWSGGTNEDCPVLTTTNLNPAVVWVPVATNTVGANGLSTNSLPVNHGEPQRFYILSIPYN